ncbi:MAG: hypothetical protein HY777_04740 [Betaproteobacteria bacterium]|nr:hypothetical protein [Betaproteobacteria bacterium]
MTEKTIPELQAELERLRLHANDVLAERKSEKQRREDAENAVATLTAERDSLIARIDDLTLSGPVLRALESVTAAPPAQGRKLLEDAGIKFAIGKSGNAVARDGDEEIALSDLHRHLSKKCESADGMSAFGWIIRSSGVSGSGAIGGASPGYSHPAQKPASPTLVQNLGFR